MASKEADAELEERRWGRGKEEERKKELNSRGCGRGTCTCAAFGIQYGREERGTGRWVTDVERFSSSPSGHRHAGGRDRYMHTAGTCPSDMQVEPSVPLRRPTYKKHCSWKAYPPSRGPSVTGHLQVGHGSTLLRRSRALVRFLSGGVGTSGVEAAVVSSSPARPCASNSRPCSRSGESNTSRLFLLAATPASSVVFIRFGLLFDRPTSSFSASASVLSPPLSSAPQHRPDVSELPIPYTDRGRRFTQVRQGATRGRRPSRWDGLELRSLPPR